MSKTERIIQALLFEIGAVVLGLLIIRFIPHEGQPLVLMILLSLTAMVWNFVFNWIFDKIFTGDRLERGVGVRLLHAVLFEGFLLLATVPMIMYMMHMDLVTAFMADIAMTLVILGYTYIYNWIYDHVRVYVMKWS